MQNFDQLKDIWQQANVPDAGSGFPKLSSHSERNRTKLQRAQLVTAIVLLYTALFLGWMAIWGGFGFRMWYTYAAIGILSALCFVQAVIGFYTYMRIRSIDDAAPPAQHLKQWESYYQLRKKQLVVWAPVFALILSVAMGVYLIEVTAYMPTRYVVLVVAVIAAWILFAVFYLGKKNQKKEEAKLQRIIDELKDVGNQFL